MPRELILASGSAIRAELLKNTNLAFRICPASIDELSMFEALRNSGSDAADMASALASAKAQAVSESHGDALVIGADQVLVDGGRPLQKVATRAAARERLLNFAGRRHELISAVAVAEGGSIRFAHQERVGVHIRPLLSAEVDGYLDHAGPGVLGSVACYEIERGGAWLIERLDGDYFSALGLPLFALLGFLRSEGWPDGR